ncbi:hypothetical protein B0T26DRAFT_133605 [Lasiosphaeria miniovina]|uniref:Secreted protein n=1 Tax=Lasiosphaeria miniovina TaxID=1954250 RepID=A0AA40B4A4_9PEZI|nr:uncharacterized protein B0T26DRAFT_133605 [Lasiosphaeria miniovina]KAK0727396.1 hypothetical protein B0T26DRAFT_133605 [Lasiosphaeria miniovina]
MWVSFRFSYALLFLRLCQLTFPRTCQSRRAVPEARARSALSRSIGGHVFRILNFSFLSELGNHGSLLWIYCRSCQAVSFWGKASQIPFGPLNNGRV